MNNAESFSKKNSKLEDVTTKKIYKACVCVGVFLKALIVLPCLSEQDLGQGTLLLEHPRLLSPYLCSPLSCCPCVSL